MAARNKLFLVKTNSGSAMVEALLATLVLSLVVSGGLALMYLCFARVWIDRTAYEAAICLGSAPGAEVLVGGTFSCEQAARTSIHGSLPIGNIKIMSLMRTVSHARVRIAFEIDGLPALERTEVLLLPLKAKAQGDRAKGSLRRRGDL